MKKTTQTAKEKAADSSPMLFEDVRLNRGYSVMAIATLAAGCRGRDPFDRIEDAVELLATAEQLAFTGKWEKYRRWKIADGDIQGATPEKIDSERQSAAEGEKGWARILEICTVARRDPPTGKIIRSSLVLEACKGAGISKKDTDSGAHANRLFNEWLCYAANESAEGLTMQELTEALGPLPWGDDSVEKYRKCVDARKSDVHLVKKFKATLESIGKVPLIHDYDTAKWLVHDFLHWLEGRPKRKYESPVRSHKESTKGRVVSPKTRGATRKEDGRYSPSE